MAPASRQVRSSRAGDLIARVRAIDPHAVDALVALAFTVAALGTAADRIGEHNEFRQVDVPGVALLLLQTLPLAVRRVAPLGVLAVICLAIVAYSAAGYQVVQAGTYSSLLAVYGVASLTDTRRGIVGAAIIAAALASFFATTRDDFGSVSIAITSGTWAVGWFVGTYVRIRGEQAEAAGALVDRLEREQEVRAREAVADERARMARELHDIVGHALNLIVIQAAGARRVLESKPEIARDSLESIESVGREALSDMERMLGVMRAAGQGEPDLGPQPGLQQLDSLAAQVSEAGLLVEVTVEGRRSDLPASVELSAYRIVQESLTNALKHSHGTRARVSIRYGPGALDIEIVDDGRGLTGQKAQSDRDGRGLIGMRERVAVFGGELTAGPMPAGGYRVRARLPLKSVDE